MGDGRVPGGAKDSHGVYEHFAHQASQIWDFHFFDKMWPKSAHSPQTNQITPKTTLMKFSNLECCAFWTRWLDEKYWKPICHLNWCLLALLYTNSSILCTGNSLNETALTYKSFCWRRFVWSWYDLLGSACVCILKAVGDYSRLAGGYPSPVGGHPRHLRLLPLPGWVKP